MCEICGGYFCYPSCPSFVGESAELGKRLLQCACCGIYIYEADDFSIENGRAYCAACTKGR